MKYAVYLRGLLIRGLRRPLAALSSSALGRASFRGWLTVLGGPTSLDLHDEMLASLTARKLPPGNRSRLIQRLRSGARTLRFTPGILQTAGMDDGTEELRTLVVLWSLPPERVAAIVEELRAESAQRSGFVPVYVTDCDDFDAFRKHQCLFEYIPERTEWTEHHGDAGWLPYVSRRISEILQTWDPDRVLLLDDANGEALRRDGVLPALHND